MGSIPTTTPGLLDFILRPTTHTPISGEVVPLDLRKFTEIYAAIEWELTFRLCPAYGVQWTPEMEKNHNNALSIARSMNPEVSDLYFQPNA
jgi:hypothetical protein